MTLDEIKQEFTPKVSILAEKVNEIAAVIEAVSGKQVLVIIDDIDKLNRSVVKEVFQDNIKSLFLPNFRIIYTLPIWALRDLEILPVVETETNNQIVSMRVMKIYAKGETHKKAPEVPIPQSDVVATLEKILLLRLDRDSYLQNPDQESDLIDAEAITLTIRYSGGVLRELIRIANESCRICLLLIREYPDRAIKIDADVVNKAVNNLRIQMGRPLGKKDYEILRQIRQNYTPDDPQDPSFFPLLRLLSVIEYRNNREWYDVHPIMIDLLNEWFENNGNP